MKMLAGRIRLVNSTPRLPTPNTPSYGVEPSTLWAALTVELSNGVFDRVSIHAAASTVMVSHHV